MTAAIPGETGTQATPVMPALYLGHGAPPLLDDPMWTDQLREWTANIPRPKAILMVSAHWESAPLALSATGAATPLVYDFGGFEERFYRMTYPTPDASALAARVAAAMPDTDPVHVHPSRGLDHGAWVPLKIMYPDADIPALQLSLPTADPVRLLDIGRRLRPLREEGVLVIGSGFLTHGLPFLRDFRREAKAPGWSADFDAWAGEALARGDIETLANFHAAPGMPYAHPTPEHFLPLFVTLGAAENPETPSELTIDGFWMGLSKRSFQVV
jgi:4,5-DOPA dioxygenase extradiol